MKPAERDPILYLEDMQKSMERVQEYISGLDFQGFKWDYKTVDAVIRNFEIIGEAAKNLPQNLKEKYPEVPWDDMYGLRNRIAHQYFGIDYEIIWDIASNYLAENQSDIDRILVLENNKSGS